MESKGHVGLYGRLVRSFGAQGLQLAARVVQQIVLVPLLVSGWGKEIYSDWIVLFAAANFVTMLELGTQAYFGNLLLKSWSSGDRDVFDRVLGNALLIQVAIVVLACAAAGLVSLAVDWPIILGVRALPPHAALWAFVLLSAGNLATIPQSVMSTIYRARGEFSRLVNMVTMLIVFETMGMAAAVLAGGSPVTTAAVYCAAIGLAWILLIVDQRRRYRDLRYGLRMPRRRELRHLAVTVPFYLVTSAAATAVSNGPIIVLQAFAPGASIIAFASSRLLVGILRQLTHQMAHASGVEMARQHVQDETEELRRLFLQTGKLAGGIFGLFGGALIVAAGPFFSVWTRGNVPFEPWLFAALLANVYIILPGQAALTLLYYSNRPRAISVSATSHAVCGLALAAVLAPKYGAIGAALGLAIVEGILMGLWLARVGARLIGVSLGPYLAATYGIAALSFTLSYAVSAAIAQVLPPRGLLGLATFGLVWGAAVMGPAFFLIVPRKERMVLGAGVQRWAPQWRRGTRNPPHTTHAGCAPPPTSQV